MGKFQSRIATKRRQSPEGGSLASNANCQREMKNCNIQKTKLTENLYVELRKNNTNCNLKVLLPKKTPHRGNNIHLQVKKQIKTRNSHASVLYDGAQQEWIFTLYNFDNSGKTSKEDMCSLIHSIYEALEASVKQLHGHTRSIKIKLIVTPAADPENNSQIAIDKEQRVSPEAGPPEGRLYGVDENIERRNHYLDLAGIENYSSKFDDTDASALEPRLEAEPALQFHPVVIRENCIFPEPPLVFPAHHSLKSRVMSVGKDRNGGEGKSYRFHGQHPASWVHPTQSLPTAQRTHSKRLRSRPQDAASHAGPTPDGEIFYPHQPSCGALTSRAQRHEHHHHHDHHHHHYHHYHPS